MYVNIKQFNANMLKIPRTSNNHTSAWPILVCKEIYTQESVICFDFIIFKLPCIGNYSLKICHHGTMNSQSLTCKA